ncbi:hypothetical protein BD309DRAFT_949357 [Dichomitus squalens]|uniref:Uncharacterized protein n=1 Tax=Dichomitus squalens TaxID=114155 RepID=A0A4Q9P2K3_9APHY|nr:uncharacterized protein DICSQDRAFT_82875 [Dichomitus squalens LYAD-421 SS1]EJF63336.1 hypothetical protein DICSQDRAFT_82875 [Dichomitus squalens LYAD-421 SS1]TBU29932.1 hypothetical protein BD311DRAFT_755476 [Dichomitus squalens]TBU48544.1 hypothetical protein BD309DRAFT_949357 [Dichomitus squalens]TBU53656.1 hypothetical protein BD310DRAFT_937585 [Dichomitus squalens]
MEAPKPAMTTSAQPQAVQMSAMNPPARQGNQTHSEECQRKRSFAERLRGGGAARDCFLGIVECFICFECCKDCCECFADIICCPCEMCC